jgi:hypothetical protein
MLGERKHHFMTKRSNFRALLTVALAIWVINSWLLMLYLSAPGVYQAYRAAGVQWYGCVDWGEDGHPHGSDACADPRPADPVP